MTDKETSALKIDFDDELVKATLLTRDGKVVHPNFARADAPEGTSGTEDQKAGGGN